MERRHDIDALRAIAFALVILYHVAMYYVAGWPWHIKSPHAAEWLQWPMRALNLWRMDLVFLISGLSLGILLARRGEGLLADRSRRLLVPLAFGMAVVVPYQAYAQALANGVVTPGFAAFLLRYATLGPWPKDAFDGAQPGITWNHLWYLAYLWLYTAAFLAMPRMERARDWLRGLRGWRFVVLPALPLMLASLLLWPHFKPYRDLVGDWWSHAVFFTLFTYGAWIATDGGWWAEARRLRWPLLAGAVTLLVAAFTVRALWGWSLPARIAADAYLWTAILAALGWAHHLLNRPWPWLTWANESVFPWYVLHQTLIIWLAVQLAPWSLGPLIEPAVLVVGTGMGCWGLTAIVRRSAVLRPLFGLKRPARPRCPSPETPAGPAARSA